MNNDCSDDSDINRQMGSLYSRSNYVVRNFSNCSVEVKRQLFSIAYCSSMYCVALWCNFKKHTNRKLTVACNNSFRRLIFLPKWCSASGMFVHSAVNYVGELWRRLTLSFRNRVLNSKNSIVEHTYSSLYVCSAIHNQWHIMFYTSQL